MPVQYEGILAEYQHTRRAVTVFDISHMGEFLIEGDCVNSGLDRIFTMSLVDMPIRTAKYGMMLNEHGGTIDDCLVFRILENKWFIVVNGATASKDAHHIQRHINETAQFHDATFEIGKIDIQGPLSRDIMKKLIPDIVNLDYFAFDYFDLLGKNVLVSRTGYTGELGYEIFYPWQDTAILWDELLKFENVKPAGLGARDILRLEAGYSLYGHELSEDITPLEAGLSRFVDFNKEFIGKKALLKQKQEGLNQKLVGLMSESRKSPREGQIIYSQTQKEIGRVSSGTFSPYLNKGIGVGFVVTQEWTLGQKIYFGSPENQVPAQVTGRAFYKQGSIKS